MQNLKSLKEKQNQLIKHLKLSGINLFKKKINNQLSPIGWHIIHCLYIECIWIRSYFLNDSFLVNKLKCIADSIHNPPKNRGLNLPNFDYLYNFSKVEFGNNLKLIESLIKKKNKDTLNYFLQFLINHHAQHIETIKIILNLINLKYNKNKMINFSTIDAKEYYFDPVSINENFFNIGAKADNNFSYDNEKPQKKIKIKKFSIDKKLIKIDEWLGFIYFGGYKKKELWSQKGWDWKYKNKVLYPLNWTFEGQKLSLSTPYGFKRPIKDDPVTNISYFELEAFANWKKLKIPHEFQWEAAYSKLINKFKVWEWCRNIFFPYKNFIAFPYKDYSEPWFNTSYHTLKGSSKFTDKKIKRKTFRNFYKPDVRYIFSGGRLSNN